MRSIVFSSLILLGLILNPSRSQASRSPSNETRISHAKELLGKGYRRSAIRKTEKLKSISEFVHQSTQKFLPKAFKSSARSVASTILTESEKYGFDPIFLMAVIQNESSFNPKIKGSVGEIGLMQIKPDTAEWIAKAYNISYRGEKSLYQPETNIKIGAAYLNKLRGQFDADSSLYLSAYNAGARKVRMLVAENKSPKIYATAVMKRYFKIYERVSDTFWMPGASKSGAKIAQKIAQKN